MFYFSLKCYSEDIDKEALLFGIPMYIHSRVRYDLYHMSLDRTNMDSIDRPIFDLLKVFFYSSSDEEKMTKSRVSLKHPGQIVKSECRISSAYHENNARLR